MKTQISRLLLPIKINHHLHDVFGEQQQLLQLVIIGIFGILTPCLLLQLFPETFNGLPWWKATLAVIVIADIAAGCIANFSRATNDYYSKHSSKRWCFIAIHWHLLILVFALEQTYLSSAIVTIFTLLSAIVVNLLRTNEAHKFYAGTLMAVGFVGINLLEQNSVPLLIVQCLFMFKVIFSFSVDHYQKENQIQ